MANNTLNTILTNQNVEYRANKAQRESIDTQLTQALSNLDTLANRVYSYTHEAIVTDDLEKDYQDIITANPDLANVSAVGLLAILSDGDTVTAQGNRLFINGTEEQSDYSFSGENSDNGIEVVKIWYFQNSENPITLQESFKFDNVALIYRHNTQYTPNISSDYWSSQTVVIYGNYVPTGNFFIKNLFFKDNMISNVISNVSTFYSEQTEFGFSKTYFTNTNVEKRIVFPNLESISNSYYDVSCFDNIRCELSFPKLKKTSGYSNSKNVFLGGNQFRLIFPNTMESLGNYTVAGQVYALLRLECKDAQIGDTWCISNQLHQKFELCSDWGASINIAKAAYTWDMTKYIDLMINKLRDMTVTEETRTLTIPSAKLTAMQADTEGQAALAAAEAKGWTVGGA